MAWPLSQDFNEAIQNPSSAFRDPDLKNGKVTTTPIGVPLPRSGNYADVYQVTDTNGNPWAVKCFTRAVAPDLQARYAAIAGHIAQTNLPFTVGFEFLAEGIRIKGKFFPVLKMQWVEGLALNTFVKENLNRATILENMLSLWVRLCRRLRESGMAHCDLQHGNVILVPGEKTNMLGIKLVDYDGMYVPALAGKNPGEAGHASYQHPQRVTTNAYSADLDRFPHLVVATALRGLLVGGKPLWDKYDTGDNLLFNAKDFTNPAQSKVLKELWDSGDPFTVGLLSHLVIAARKPLAATPWLDTLMPEGRPPVLTPSQERQAMQILGVSASGVVPASLPTAAGSAWSSTASKSLPAPAADLGFDESESGTHVVKALARKKYSSFALFGTLAGVLAVIGIGVGIVAFGGKKPGSSSDQASAGLPPASSGPVEPPVAPPKADPPVAPPVTPPTPAIKDGKVVWSIPAGDVESGARAMCYSHDGSKLIVSMAKSGQISVFDAKSGSPVTSFTDHAPVGVALAAPLPAGKILSIGSEPVLMVWDDATGKAASRIASRGPAGKADVLQTDREGHYALIAAGLKAAVIDLDETEQTLLLDLAGSGIAGRAAAMMAADGSKVLTIKPGGKLAITPIPSGPEKEVPLAAGLLDAAIIVAWSPSKNIAVVRTRLPDGKLDGTLRIISTSTGESGRTLTGYSNRCTFTSDGEYLIAVTGDVVHYLDPLTAEVKFAVPLKGANTLIDVAANPFNSTAAFITGTERRISLLSPDAAVTTPLTPTPIEAATVVNLSPTLTLTRTDLGNASIISATADRDGKMLAFTDGAKVRVIEIATKKEVFTTNALGKIRQIWFTDAGLVVNVLDAKSKNEILVFDDRGNPVRNINIDSKSAVHSVAVSSSGELAAVTREIGNVTVYDLKENKPVHNILVWEKEKPPSNPTVRALWPEPADKLYVWRSTRLQVYPVGDLNTFRFFTPGGATKGISDVSPDGRFVAFRQIPSNGTTTFFIKQPNENWLMAGLRASIKEAGFVALRFLGNGGRVAIVVPGKVLISHTVPGSPMTEVRTGHPATVNGVTVNTSRTVLTIFGGSYVSVLTSAAYDPNAVVTGSPVKGPDTAPRPAARKPVPGEDAIRKAETTVKDLYKEQFARKLTNDRRRLAETLIKLAGETTNDLAAKYYLLKEVQSIAIEVHDSALGAKAIEILDDVFEVDGTALRVGLLERIGNNATKTDVLKALAETCGEMVEDLAEKNEFDKAIKVCTVGLAALARANLQNFGRELEARLTQLRKQKDAFEPVKAALETLKMNSADPEANLIVGKYRCFIQGHWAAGLPHLATGSDEMLKTAATLDLNDTAGMMRKADAWWSWAQSQQDAEKAAALSRAKTYYAKILNARATGLERVTAENRLSFSQGGIDYRPGLMLEVLPYGGAKLTGVKKTVKLSSTGELLGTDYKTLPGGAVGVKFIGFLVAPTAGRYRIVADGKSKLFIKLFSTPDQKTIIDIRDPDGTTNKKDALVVLPAKPVALYIEALLSTSTNGSSPANTGPHSISLKWLRPGEKTEEVIPADALFHNKASEITLTEK